MVYDVVSEIPATNKSINVGLLNNYMGTYPNHFPKTEFKLSYNTTSLLLRFDVSDNFIIANSRNHFDSVWEDSCVEFFFTPSENIENGYFNFEINCCGKLYAHFQKSKRNGVERIDLSDIGKMNIKSHFVGTITQEIATPTNWFIEFEIPFEVLKKYTEVIMPQKGAKWRANFYKCADSSSHPHWITWNKINFPQPNFHLPEFFGTLNFE